MSVDPISGVVTLLQQTIPQLVTILYKFTPDGKAKKVVADMQRAAAELAGCIDTGLLAPERVEAIQGMVELYVTPRSLLTLLNFFALVSFRAREN
jgi:hypothetical protein